MKNGRVKLGELCNVVTKGTTPTSLGYAFVSVGIPFLRIQNLGNSTVSLKKVLYINEETHQALKRSIIKPKDFLITIAGTIGRVAIVPDDFPECNCNQAVAILRFDQEKLYPQYLLHWLSTNDAIGQISGKKVTATISNLSLGQIKELEIPLPPLAEQKRIAGILDKADNLRRKRQQAIKLADEFLRSVFLDMFGDPVTNPKGWKVVEIEEVCTDIVDCINKTAKTVNYETPYKMIRTTNVRDYKIDVSSVRFAELEVYEKWVSRLIPEKGDIVFTREAPAGEAGIVDTDDLVFLGQRTMQFRPNYKRVNSTYLLYEMMGGGIKRQMDKMSSGSTVKHLSVPECKKFKVRVPKLVLQTKFEEICNKVNKLVDTNKDAADTPLFYSLSQKAFAGQL